MARYQLAEQRFARALGGALLLFAVASCDGAGLTLSTSKLTFDAPDTCSTPPGQTVHASVPPGTGKVFVNITFVGPAVASISNVNITSDTTGEATVFPARADELGRGTYTSVITVKGSKRLLINIINPCCVLIILNCCKVWNMGTITAIWGKATDKIKAM